MNSHGSTIKKADWFAESRPEYREASHLAREKQTKLKQHTPVGRVYVQETSNTLLLVA